MGKILALLLTSIACSACGGGGGGGSGSSGGQNTGTDYDCSVFPPAESSPYILPWQVDTTHEANPHALRDPHPQKYSIDIPMPIGTEILAMRDGAVVGVRERYVDGDNVFGRENYVFVQHDDGTMARYIHLTNNGALVDVGDFVRQGDVIALSGNTGNSTGPHLHFDVIAASQVTADYSLQAGAGTIPLNFSNATASNGDLSCGLRVGVFYTAEPF